MEKDEQLAWRIIKRLEAIRKAENMSVLDFCGYFDIVPVSYYHWVNAARDRKTIKLSLPIVERGLNELGYDAWIIIEKREKIRR